MSTVTCTLSRFELPMCYVLLSIKCAEPHLPLTPLGNMNRLAPVATNQRETRLVTFTVESFNACRPLCPTNSSTVTQGPSGRQAETESGQPSKHPYGHWHVEKKQACLCSWSCNVHWTEGPKALSHVMLFNIKEAIVIDACCGETHRHTTFTKKPGMPYHTMQAQRYAGEEPRLYPLQCWVCHGVASGDAFSSVSLFNTVVGFSAGFSSFLSLAFMFDTWPRP